MTAALISILLVEVPSGVIADQIGRKKVVVTGLILGAAEMALIALWPTFQGFFIGAIIGGAGWALVSGADHSLIYDSLKNPKKESKKIFGKEKAIRYIAIVLAALIGAPIYAQNQELTFYLSSASFLLAAVAFSTITENHTPIKSTFATQWQHLKESFQFSFKSRKLLWFIFFGIFSGFSVYMFHDLLRSPVLEGIGYPIATLGAVVAVMAGSRAIISYHTESIENFLGERTTRNILLFGPAPLFVLTAFFYNKFALVFLILLYWIWSLQEVVVRSSTHEHMTKTQRATLSSIQGFYDSIIAGLGFLLMGLLVTATNLPTALSILGIISFISGIILYLTYNE